MSHVGVSEPPAGGLRALYGRSLEWLVGILMVVLFLEVTAGVIFRTLGHPLVWYDEVASMLLAWLTFYGSALASFKRAHIGCPEIVDLLPPGPRRWFSVAGQLVVIGFFALVGWMGLKIMPILATDSMSSLPTVTMDILQSVIPISAVLILISEFLTLFDLLRQRPQA
jgi:TRAP-type C4-dicarboxylate transport system permease small subunit